MAQQGFPPPRSAPAHGRAQPGSGFTSRPDPRYGEPLDPRYGEQLDPRYGEPPDPRYGEPPEPANRDAPDPGYADTPDPGYGDAPDLSYDDDVAARPRRRIGRGAWRDRRSRLFWSAIGLAVVGAAVVIAALVRGGSQPDGGAIPGALVTTFMPGEVQQVPSACGAVSAAVLDRYMPGRSKPAAAQPLQGKAASQCSWTVDDPHRYRFMEVVLQAYGPSGLASGNGSATQAARDAFVAARLAKQFPARQSKQPKANVSEVSRLGQEAFLADQHYHRGPRLDMETLLVRDRNVLVTVIFEARTGGSYGPDPVGVLRTGAQAAARAALSRLH